MPIPISWLLDGDPAVVWQVERDLLGRAESLWARTRNRTQREGLGATLWSKRAADGTWGGGLYNPKWTSTFYTLQLLTQLGIPPGNDEMRASCVLLLERGVTASGGVRLWKSPATDTCVTAMLLGMASYFNLWQREDVRRMVGWLLSEQMEDGGWNCRRARGATHSSFHTTTSVLEGLAAIPQASISSKRVKIAVRRGQQFMLDHQLYRSSTTGRVVRSSFSRFSFPTYWYFDVLRGLEYFANVGYGWDDRLSDPVTVLKKRQAKDGRWHAQNVHPGKTHVRLDACQMPSRMVTLRALRVLRWYEAAGP